MASVYGYSGTPLVNSQVEVCRRGEAMALARGSKRCRALMAADALAKMRRDKAGDAAAGMWFSEELAASVAASWREGDWARRGGGS